MVRNLNHKLAPRRSRTSYKNGKKIYCGHTNRYRNKLRNDYANDTAQLIASANVVAIEFQTIAAANNYWKTENEFRND